jgi:acyl-CoA thioester hydrolase
MKNNLCAEHRIRVPFYDVDSMEVVWHGNYLKYFEEARCVLLDKIDYNYEAMRASGYAWPVVDVRIKYIKPLRFNQAIDVQVEMTEWENRLRLDYCIVDANSREKLSQGHSIQVAVDMEKQELQFVLPAIFRDKVERMMKV